MTTAPATSSELRTILAAQPALDPGTEGFWQVWGARPSNIRPGDALLIAGEADWVLVTDTFEAKAAPMRVGLVIDGERTTLGALCRIALMRPSTHNILA